MNALQTLTKIEEEHLTNHILWGQYFSDTKTSQWHHSGKKKLMNIKWQKSSTKYLQNWELGHTQRLYTMSKYKLTQESKIGLVYKNQQTIRIYSKIKGKKWSSLMMPKKIWQNSTSLCDLKKKKKKLNRPHREKFLECQSGICEEADETS